MTNEDMRLLWERAERVAERLHGHGVPIIVTMQRKGERAETGELGMGISINAPQDITVAALELLANQFDWEAEDSEQSDLPPFMRGADDEDG